MELVIKTLGEIQDARVTIEVPGQRLYTAREVGDAQTSEAELVSAPLRRRITELSSVVTAYDQRNSELKAELKICRDAISRQRQTIEELEARVKGYDGDRHTERDRANRAEAELKAANQRADENKAWAERAEAEVERRLTKAQVTDEVARRGNEIRHELDAKCRNTELARNVLADQLGKIRAAVTAPYVADALVTSWTSWAEREASAVGRAVADVREIVGSPDLRGEPTSQA